MSRRVQGLAVLLVVAGCNDENGAPPGSSDSSAVRDRGVPGVAHDSGTTAAARDRGATLPPGQDVGLPPPPPLPHGKLCTDGTGCASTEICVKLASDNYSRTGPPPPTGMCLTRCSNTTAPCSSSATHFHPCTGLVTWDLGSIQACAIACYTNFAGVPKSYACPAQTHCSRSMGGIMKICTPYP